MRNSDTGTNLKETIFTPNGAQQQPEEARAAEENISVSAKTGKRHRGAKIAKSVFFVVLFAILLPFLLIFYLVRGIVRKIKKRKWEREGMRDKMLLLGSTITDVDIMEGYEFEEYLKSLFFYEGYRAEVTQRARDYGADLVLEKEDEKIVVQAKRYAKGVGIKSVQEVLGAMKHYGATDAWVVTNSYFTPEAELVAKENGVRLIDRDELIEIQQRVREYLKLYAKESDLVDKRDKDIEDRYPYMI